MIEVSILVVATPCARLDHQSCTRTFVYWMFGQPKIDKVDYPKFGDNDVDLMMGLWVWWMGRMEKHDCNDGVWLVR